MKIQCSDATYMLLKKLGGFRVECRGNISVKVISCYQSVKYCGAH